MSGTSADARWKVVYDDACGFCRWVTARILRWDRRGALEAVALSDPRIPTLLADVPVGLRPESWHLVAPGGGARSAGAAAGPLLRLLPGGRPLAWIVEAMPGVTERAYRWVARNRGTFGRMLGEERCSTVPTRPRD